MALIKTRSRGINLADDFAFTGTITGAGESNTPAFYAGKTSNQSVSDNTITKVTWNEAYDTDSAFASDKFTVPSGKAGKYNFYIQQFYPNYNNHHKTILCFCIFHIHTYIYLVFQNFL